MQGGKCDGSKLLGEAEASVIVSKTSCSELRLCVIKHNDQCGQVAGLTGP